MLLSYLPSTTGLVEPVSLDLLRSVVRVDGDQDNAYLNLLNTAAREWVQQHLGYPLAGGQVVELTYELGEDYVLPAGATPTSVRGFFTSLDDLQNWSWVEYQKGISINRQLPLSVAVQQTYTVTASLPSTDKLAVPATVKAAITKIVAEWYRNREESVAGVANVAQVPIGIQVMLAPFRQTNVLF